MNDWHQNKPKGVHIITSNHNWTSALEADVAGIGILAYRSSQFSTGLVPKSAFFKSGTGLSICLTAQHGGILDNCTNLDCSLLSYGAA